LNHRPPFVNTPTAPLHIPGSVFDDEALHVRLPRLGGSDFALGGNLNEIDLVHGLLSMKKR
jgi:hypothetical protein